MKNLKKLISVVLCIAMVASFMSISVSAASYGDVDETKSSYAAVELLSALGILKGDTEGNFNPEADIKRSEFAAVVCRALGQENAATGTVSKFDDVSSEHWAVGYIAWAAGKGIVNGYGDGNFGPDDNIKYQDAIKMIVSALGFTPIAEDKGGYPYGYIAVAGTYGITSGLSVPYETAATREVVAQLTYNALEAPLMDATYYATGEKYVVYDGSNAADGEERTILSYYLDIVKVKANVLNTYKSDANLWKKGQDPKVELKITKIYNKSDKTEYEGYVADAAGLPLASVKAFVGDTEASEYLANDVVAYAFVNEDDDLELAAIIPDAKATDSLEIAKNLDTAVADVADDATNAVTFSYWEDIENDNKMTDIDVANTAIVYVNGSKVGTSIADGGAGEAAFEAIATTANSVLFIGPRNGEFDRVFITKYEYSQVEKIDLEDEYVVCDNTSIELSKEARNNDQFVYTIYKDGAEIALEDLKAGDVISVVYPGSDIDTAAYIDIYVSSETLTGTVTSVKAASGKYFIDKVEYAKVAACSLAVGDTGVFYLTADGKIYNVEKESSVSDNYGYILKVGSSAVFGENTWQIRLFTKEGKVETYDVASTLKVSTWAGTDYTVTPYKKANNGQDTYMNSLAALTAPVYVDANRDNTLAPSETLAAAKATVKTNAEKRLITYTVVDNEITKITEAATVASSYVDKAFDSKDLAAAGAYKPAMSRFAGYTYSDATKLFYTPIPAAAVAVDDGNALTTEDDAVFIAEDDVALLAMAALDEDINTYDGYIYNTTKAKDLGAAVITSNLGFAGKANALAVVTDKATALNANGEQADQITVFQGGAYASYVIAEDADIKAVNGLAGSFAGIDIGDVVQFVVNGAEEVSQLNLVYDMGAKGFGTIAADPSADIKFGYGILANVSGAGFDIATDFEDESTYVGLPFDYEEGCTMAQVDVAKLGTSGAIKKISTVTGFRATKDTYTAQYVVVVRVVDDVVVDAVSYILDGATIDTDTDAAGPDTADPATNEINTQLGYDVY